MIPTSRPLLLMAKAPTTEKTRMTGRRMRLGIWTMRLPARIAS